jgi:hypothetical protein
MKHLQSKSFLVITAIVLFLGYAVSCTKNDQIINGGVANNSGTDLVSLKVSAAPTLDGTIDASWANCQKLTTTVTVPDPGNEYFKGYVGNTHTVSLRSMYDGSKIYFLERRRP